MLQCQATPISLYLTRNYNPRLLIIIIITIIIIIIMIMIMMLITIIIILFYTSKLHVLGYFCWFTSSRNYMSVISLPNNLF